MLSQVMSVARDHQGITSLLLSVCYDGIFEVRKLEAPTNT